MLYYEGMLHSSFLGMAFGRQIMAYSIGGFYKDAFTPLAPYFVSSLKSRHPLRFFMKKETLRCDSRESIASRFIEPANNDCGLWVGLLCKKQDLSFGQVVVFPYLRRLESE